MIEYCHDKEISDAQLRPLYQAIGWTAYLDQVCHQRLGPRPASGAGAYSGRWPLCGLDPRHLSSASLSEAGHRPTIAESNSGSQPGLSSGLSGD